MVPDAELNFKKMLLGRIDVYLTSLIVGYDIIHQIFEPSKASLFTNHPKKTAELDMFVLFSKSNPNSQEIADAFDTGLKNLKISGRYHEIIENFLLD